ncbi:MAG TPA: hypothetical protein VNP72_00970 [Longimicrobium sp.]|nr:hypothetical protein [Longimicrobium sp.]
MKGSGGELSALARTSRRTALLSLLSFVIIVGSLVYSAANLNAASKKVASLKVEAQKLTNQKSALDLEVKELTERRANLDSAVKRLANTVASSSPTSETRAAVAFALNAKYAIGFYALRAGPSRYEGVRDSLQARGYALIRGGNLPERTSWLAQRSSVLYYDDSPVTVAKANEVAEMLHRLTGDQFLVVRGRGLGVAARDAAESFRAHWIPGSPAQ